MKGSFSDEMDNFSIPDSFPVRNDDGAQSIHPQNPREWTFHSNSPQRPSENDDIHHLLHDEPNHSEDCLHDNGLHHTEEISTFNAHHHEPHLMQFRTRNESNISIENESLLKNFFEHSTGYQWLNDTSTQSHAENFRLQHAGYCDASVENQIFLKRAFEHPTGLSGHQGFNGDTFHGLESAESVYSRSQLPRSKRIRLHDSSTEPSQTSTTYLSSEIHQPFTLQNRGLMTQTSANTNGSVTPTWCGSRFPIGSTFRFVGAPVDCSSTNSFPGGLTVPFGSTFNFVNERGDRLSNRYKDDAHDDDVQGRSSNNLIIEDSPDEHSTTRHCLPPQKLKYCSLSRSVQLRKLVKRITFYVRPCKKGKYYFHPSHPHPKVLGGFLTQNKKGQLFEVASVIQFSKNFNQDFQQRQMIQEYIHEQTTLGLLCHVNNKKKWVHLPKRSQVRESEIIGKRGIRALNSAELSFSSNGIIVSSRNEPIWHTITRNNDSTTTSTSYLVVKFVVHPTISSSFLLKHQRTFFGLSLLNVSNDEVVLFNENQELRLLNSSIKELKKEYKKQHRDEKLLELLNLGR